MDDIIRNGSEAAATVNLEEEAQVEVEEKNYDDDDDEVEGGEDEAEEEDEEPITSKKRKDVEGHAPAMPPSGRHWKIYARATIGRWLALARSPAPIKQVVPIGRESKSNY
jgi:hypothetical protein